MTSSRTKWSTSDNESEGDWCPLGVRTEGNDGGAMTPLGGIEPLGAVLRQQ